MSEKSYRGGCFGFLTGWSGLVLAMIMFQLYRCGTTFKNSDKISSIAQNAVQEFHGFQNQQKCEDIVNKLWAEEALTKQRESIVEFCKNTKTEFGDIRSSTLTGSTIESNLHGTFAVLQYKTTFAKASEREVFTWQVQNGQAKLVGYDMFDSK